MYKQGDRVAYVHSKDMSVVDSYRDKKGFPAVAVVRYVNNGFVHATIVTGPNKGVEATFLESEIVPSMKIVSVKRGSAVKLFGKVLGESGKVYSFGYIRNAAFRGWVCTCDDFLHRRIPSGQNCKHLHFVRAELGRYGTEAEAN